MIYTQSYLNSLENPDGFGFYDLGTGIWKTQLSPKIILNLGGVLNSHITFSPIMSHVRKATFTNNVKTVEEQTSHPFETSKINLAHNGYLEPRDDKIFQEKEYKDCIDSEIFTKVLTKNYESDFKKAIENSLKEFYGKFAFMIYDKINANHYIARGTTATLYSARIKSPTQDLGFIVNTNMEDLRKGFLFYSNLFQLEDVKLDKISEIKELDKNSLFIFNAEKNQLDKIGDLKEELKPVKVTTGYYNPRSNFEHNWRTPIQSTLPIVKTVENKYAEQVALFLVGNKLTEMDLDNLLFKCCGSTILSCTQEDLELLISYIFPIIEKEFHVNKAREWKNICFKIVTNELEIYSYFGLNYPYMLNDITVLRAVRKSLPDKMVFSLKDLEKNIVEQ